MGPDTSAPHLAGRTRCLPRVPSRTLVLLGLGSVSSLLYLSFALATKGFSLALPLSPLRKGIIPGFLAHFLVLFALYLLAAWHTFRNPLEDRSTTITLITFSIVFRALLVWTQPVISDDVYRYVWDGRVQAAGLNPYLHPPEAPALAHLRDDTLYPRINRPWARTIYPPGAEWLFRALYAARPDSVVFLKGAMVACDLFTIFLLMTLLRAARLPGGRAILYAWHPLAVFEVAGSGHLDGLMLPFLLLCLLFWERRHEAWAGIALGAAAAIKLYPALLFPALVRRRGPRLLFAAATVVGLLYLPYVRTAGHGVLGFLPQYLSDPGERFNSGPGGLLAFSLGSLSPYPTQIAYGIFGLALLTVSLRGRRTEDKSFDATIAEVLLLFGTFVTFAQTVHPWYLLWIIPLVAIRPSVCWLYLSGAVALSYLEYSNDTLHMPLWARILEYLPFYLLALFPTPLMKLFESPASLSGDRALIQQGLKKP